MMINQLDGVHNRDQQKVMFFVDYQTKKIDHATMWGPSVISLFGYLSPLTSINYLYIVLKKLKHKKNVGVIS